MERRFRMFQFQLIALKIIVVKYERLNVELGNSLHPSHGRHQGGSEGAKDPL